MRSAERTQADREIDWNATLEQALTMPGNVGNSYSRFHNYSFLNCVRLYAQGVEPQPVATFKRWQEVGRHVKRGSKAKEIIRPITVKLKDELDDEGNPKQITKFKPVRCIFALSDTEGEPLPPVEIPEWSEELALQNLDIKRVPFEMFDGNTAGYSYGRNIAVSEVAPFPKKTLMHELGHVVLGHTVDLGPEDEPMHRGVAEFQAEATAHLTTNELGISSPEEAEVSRGYIAGWLKGDKPSDVAIRGVFRATDEILKAGRTLLATPEVA